MNRKPSRRPIILPLIRMTVAIAIVFLLAGVVYFLIGLDPLAIAILLALGGVYVLFMTLLVPWRISTHYHAVKVNPGRLPRLEMAVDDLSLLFHVPRPRLLLFPSKRPNAMAFGFGARTYVGVTEGLLATLDDARLRAILAHEFAHIRNRDCITQSIGLAVKTTLIFVSVVLSALFIVAGILVAALVSSLLGAKSRKAKGGIITLSTIIPLGFLLLSPLIISISYFFFSRRSEFRADAHSAEVTERPMDLANALAEIDRAARSASETIRNGAYSSLWAVDSREDDLIGRLLSSHPPVEERIRRLMEMHERFAGG